MKGAAVARGSWNVRYSGIIVAMVQRFGKDLAVLARVNAVGRSLRLHYVLGDWTFLAHSQIELHLLSFVQGAEPFALDL